MCPATVPVEKTEMAREFDEVNNPGDAWIADKKGQIRAKTKRLNLTIHELAERAQVSPETVLRVLWEDNVRHTVNTIVSLLEALDMRTALIEGARSKPQPDEVKPLSPKIRAVLNLWVKQHREERGKKKKPKST